MANWRGTSRSNYFRVKDAQAFEADMAKFQIPYWPGEADKNDMYAISGRDDEDGYWPSAYPADDEDDEAIEFDIYEVVASHLADDEVAILMEAGAEKLRYVTGVAVAINNKGGVEEVKLDDIYEKAKKLGSNITGCWY
jgi:hypothetical protein